MEELPDKVRDCEQVARRALAVFAVVGLALGAPRDDIIGWLKDEGLWDELSPIESDYLSAAEPTDQQTVNAAWHSEALIVLLWALQKIEKLPPANEQCDTQVFLELLPPFSDISTSEFITSAKLRSEEELKEMADELTQLNWDARDAQLHSKPTPAHVDIEIVQERHLAINWVIGWFGLPWDEVTTDT